MNTQYYHVLATTLGKTNLGPRQLTATDRDDIAIQVANDLLRRDPYAAISMRFELPVYPDGTDLVRFLAKKRNMEPYAITTQVLKEQELSIASLFGEKDNENEIKGLPSPLTNPTGHYVPGNTPCVNPSKPEYALREERVPLEIPQQLTVEDCVYTYRGFIPYAAKNGEIIGGSAAYINHEQYILLPLHTCKHTLSNGYQQPCLRIGWKHSSFPFMNEDMMLSKPTLAVLLCLDSLIADKLLDFINKGQLEGCIIPTCHFGGKKEFSRVNMTALRGRDIIIVPASTVDSYADAQEYATQVLEHGARSVKISSHSMLRFQKPSYTPDVSQTSDPLLRHIVTHALAIEEEWPEKLMKQIISASRSPEEYHAWGVGIRLFKEEAPQAPAVSTASGQFTILAKAKKRDATVYLDKILCCELPTLVVGPSDGGKGMLGYTLAIGLAMQLDVFHYKVCRSKSVFYIDSETPTDEALEKVSRIANGLGLGPDITIHDFEHWSLLTKPPVAVVDLTNKDFQQEIEEKISIQQPDVVFFDNMASLTEAAYDSSKKWNALFQWFREIEKKYGVAIVYLHHTNKRGKPLGRTEIEGMSRTIIILDDLEMLENESRKVNGATPYFPFLSKPGCLFRIWYKKCKPYPELKHQQYGYYLELDPNNCVRGPNWHCVEQSRHQAKDVPVAHSTTEDAEDDMNNGEDKLMHFGSKDNSLDEPDTATDPVSSGAAGLIDRQLAEVLEFARKCGSWFKRAEVEVQLNCKRETARKILAHAIKQGFLDRVVEGSETRYRIRRG